MLSLSVCRNCKLSNSHFSMATVDILYIDVTRRWASMLPGSREAGNPPANHKSPLTQPANHQSRITLPTNNNKP